MILFHIWIQFIANQNSLDLFPVTNIERENCSGLFCAGAILLFSFFECFYDIFASKVGCGIEYLPY